VRYFLLLAFLYIPFVTQAQDNGVYSVTGRAGVATTFSRDYHAVGINPANLGFRTSFRDPYVTAGTMEHKMNFFAEALTQKDVFQTLFNSNNVNFTYAQKQEAARKMAGANTALDASVMLLGGSVSYPKLGGFAFTVRDNIRFRMRLNRTASEIAFLGYNAPYFPQLLLTDGSTIRNDPALPQSIREQVYIGTFADSANSSFYSEILQGSRVAMSWTREFNLSYGRQIVDTYDFDVHIGGGVRFISGIALIDLAANANGLRRSNISMSPTFGLDFGDPADTVSAQSPTFQGFREGAVLSKLFFPKPVGQGFGLDAGVLFVIKRKLRIGASIANYGRMNWSGNVYKLNDGKLVDIAGAGFDNYNVFASAESALQFAGSRSPLAWTGDNKIETELPATIRAGISYEFLNKLNIGLDVIIPQNDAPGSLAEPFYAVGGDFFLSRVIVLSSGFSMGGDQGGNFSVPFGIQYRSFKQRYEAGISTADISSFISDFGDGSTISYAAGFLRLKF